MMTVLLYYNIYGKTWLYFPILKTDWKNKDVGLQFSLTAPPTLLCVKEQERKVLFFFLINKVLVKEYRRREIAK